MASINITIADNVLTRVLDGVCGAYNYDPASGETKAAFAKRMVAEHIKNVVRNYEAKVAEDAAIKSANSEITIT